MFKYNIGDLVNCKVDNATYTGVVCFRDKRENNNIYHVSCETVKILFINEENMSEG